MTDTTTAPQAAEAAAPSNGLRTFLIVVAIVEGLEGLFKIPLLLARDPEIPGPGWGGWAVTSELALSLPFALIALFFLVKGDLRRAIPAIAGIGLLRWISLLPSVANHADTFPGPGFSGLHSVVQIAVLPLLLLMVFALCWKNERLTLAGILAGLPAILNWLGVVAFGIGVAIYGF